MDSFAITQKVYSLQENTNDSFLFIFIIYRFKGSSFCFILSYYFEDEKDKKKSNNATYCQKYRQKLQLKRLQSKSFDKKFRKKVAMRQELWRLKKKQQQEQSIQSSSTVTMSRNDLRKCEGLQHRRQNIAKFKTQIRDLQDANGKLQIEKKN